MLNASMATDPPPKKISFLRSTFSEADGTGSASRIMMLLHFFAGASWVSFHLWKGDGAGHHPIPDLTGVTTFVCAPYGVNKIASTITAFSGPPKPPPSG
jgi:hypothetical protein